MSTPARIALLMLGAGLLFLPVGAADRTPDQTCHEVKLITRPGWTISGSWSEDGSTLRVVDLLRHEVLQYSDQGDYLGVMPGAESTFDSVLPAGKRPQNLESVFQGIRAGSDFIVFGDVLRSSLTPPWRSGFFRVPADSTGTFQSLYEISPEDPMRLFYRLGSPLIASLGETSYILIMEEHPRLVQSRQGSAVLEPLRSFPPGLEHRPSLPAWRELVDYAGVMRAVEAVSVPVALFGWEDHLYVVGRHSQEGRTRWSLTKIDPRADSVLWTATVHLPSSAHHVTVVPGARYWAWIEKGVARGLFDQYAERILFLPSSLLRNVPAGDLCQ